MFIIYHIITDKNSTSSSQNENATSTVIDEYSDSKENKIDSFSNPSEIYSVLEVIDGDTIRVDINGKNTKVRFIGVNTPETVSSSAPVQCFGPESSDYTKNMLNGKKVGLEYDDTQGNTDVYGRLLRYIYIDGKNLNYLLIKNGYGFENTNYDYRYKSEFVSAEKEARTNQIGLWSPITCNGELKAR